MERQSRTEFSRIQLRTRGSLAARHGDRYAGVRRLQPPL